MIIKNMLSEQVIEDLKEFYLKPLGSILFFGKNGRGKSYAAMKIYEQLATFKLPAHDHDTAWFINQADLNMLFSESIASDGHASNLLKQACKSKFFVLDDFGTRVPTSAFMDFLYALMDKRTNEKDVLATIITTNLESARIRKDFGDPIFSRVASGRNYVFEGKDRRFEERGF